MRATWLERWQDVVCLVVAGAIAALVFIVDGVGGLFTGPYLAGFVFIATWVVIDFLIALTITRRERQAQEEARSPEPARPRTSAKREPLPRAVARRASR